VRAGTEENFLQKAAKETKAGFGIRNPSLTSFPSVDVFALWAASIFAGLAAPGPGANPQPQLANPG
jgi:hypothetical protein